MRDGLTKLKSASKSATCLGVGQKGRCSWKNLIRIFSREISGIYKKSHRSELDNKICVLYSSFTPVVMARRDICLATRRYLSLNYCEKGFLIGSPFRRFGAGRQRVCEEGMAPRPEAQRWPARLTKYSWRA
jgi:hypothetical protein